MAPVIWWFIWATAPLARTWQLWTYRGWTVLPPTLVGYWSDKLLRAQAERLIDSRQYVLDSDWGQVQPRASDQNAYLKQHSWDDYARWHLGLTDGAADQTKARYAFVYGDFRRIHRMGIIACMYRAAEWRHKEIELAAHELLQRLDKLTS